MDGELGFISGSLLAIFQQLQTDKAHFILSILAFFEYHRKPLMICATGNYCILLVSLENASKVCHVLLQGTALNQTSKSSPQQSSSTISYRLRPERAAKSSSWIACLSQNISFHPQSHVEPHSSLRHVRKSLFCRSGTCMAKMELML